MTRNCFGKTAPSRHWLREGDENTKFFHTIANDRRWSNKIGLLEDFGRILYKEEEKQQYFQNKFKYRFALKDHTPNAFGD